MSALALIFPQFPYEVLNIILSFSEDSMITTSYHLTTGCSIHTIQWKSDPIYELESMIFVRRIFPSYWYADAIPDDKFIYFYMKSYFKQFIQQEGAWKLIQSS